MLPAFSYADYIRDKAVIDKLSVTILDALAEVIGDEELEKRDEIEGKTVIHFFLGLCRASMYINAILNI